MKFKEYIKENGTPDNKTDDLQEYTTNEEALDKEAEKYAEDTAKFIETMNDKYADDDKTLKFLKGLSDFVKKEGFLTRDQRKSLSNLNQ